MKDGSLRRADEYGPDPRKIMELRTHGMHSPLLLPPEGHPPLPLSKRTRVLLEAWRSVCAGISAVGALLIVARLFLGL